MRFMLTFARLRSIGRTCQVVAAALALVCSDGVTHGESAVTIDTDTGNAGADQRSTGWNFNVLEPIRITSLGLFDHLGDGFIDTYPVRIYNRDSGGIVAEAQLQAGAIHPLDEGFRYIVLDEDAMPILMPGTTYTIAFHMSGSAPFDEFIVTGGTYEYHPLLNKHLGSYVTLGPSFVLPQTFIPFECIGPSFQFETVPAPAAFALLAVAVMANPRRQR